MDTYGNRTKYQLDSALRTLLERKPLDQIHIREVTELCGIRRQSFYYHFTDVYQLFDWSLRQERLRLGQRQDDCMTWQQALEDLLAYTAQHRNYYLALLDSRGRAGLREALADAVPGLLKKTLTYYRQRCGGAEDAAADRERLACWEAIWLSLLEGWIRGDVAQQPETVVSSMEEMVRQSAAGAVWRNLIQQAE
jgi:AcrR family transcriptional regulator